MAEPRPRASPATGTQVCHPKRLGCPLCRPFTSALPSPLARMPVTVRVPSTSATSFNPYRLSIFGLPTLCVSHLLCNQEVWCTVVRSGHECDPYRPRLLVETCLLHIICAIYVARNES